MSEMFFIIKIRLEICLMNTSDFRDFDAFFRVGSFCICDGDQLAPVHIRPLNHLYEGEGSKVRDEKRVTKRNVATRLGQTDGLGLIEIYSTLGNQELYTLPRFCPLFSPRTAFARPIIPNYALLIPDCQR